MLEAHRNKLKQGAVLVDPNDEGLEPKVLFMVDHSVRQSGSHHDKLINVSRRLQFVTIDQQGQTTHAGWAPHLDLQSITENEQNRVQDILSAEWLNDKLDALALEYATQHLVPDHYLEVKQRRERQAEKILSAINERLVKEINYWSDRHIKLTEDVAAGKQPRLQPDNAKRRVEELTARLEQRKKELQNMANVVSGNPVVIGGALIIPQGLIAQKKGEPLFSVDSPARTRIEKIAMQAVIEKEKSLGNQIKDVSAEKCGWDITSQPPITAGRLPDARHIEVKGRAKGQSTITVSRNEIIYGLNQSDKFILAIVIVDGDNYAGPFYIKNPFSQEPDFGVASINYDLSDLLSRAVPPSDTL